MTPSSIQTDNNCAYLIEFVSVFNYSIRKQFTRSIHCYMLPIPLIYRVNVRYEFAEKTSCENVCVM